MRLLHVFPAFEVGGQQMRAVTLANAMAADPDAIEGFDNLVLSLNGDLTCAARFSGAVSWQGVDAPVCAGGLIGRLWAARQLIHSLKPDCIITYNWGAIEWAAANYWPICRHIHVDDGFGPEEANRQIRRRVLFRRAVLSRHARVVFPSLTLCSIARDIWHLPEARISYIPNGIDLAPYGSISRLDARKAYDLPPDKPVIGTLATLRPEKNLKRLIDAFCVVREKADCHLVIAGDGRERAVLEAHVRDRGLDDRVSFPGFIESPHTILPAFDVFALSSDTEQMPISVIEAMAAGLPIASLDVGDVGRMVAKENRNLVRGRDLSALSQSLHALLSEPAQREEIGAANRKFAEREFDLAKMVANWKDLFIYG